MMKIKYALVGFGGIAENRVAKEGFACDRGRFRPLAHAELVGATDLNPARRAAAEALGLAWYESLDAVLAEASVDAVYVATNNASHAQIALQALKAGKHVLVEKPIATSLADAQAMNALAKRRRLSLAVDHMMVNNPYTVAAKRALPKLGKINDSCFHMEFAYGYDPSEAATWRCARPEEMGGPVGDVASHCFYVAEFMLGRRIAKLAAVYYPKTMDIRSEDGALVRFFLEDGTQGSVRVSFCDRRGGLAGTLTNLGYEIYGEKATLRNYGSMFQLSGSSDEPIVQRTEIDDGRTVVAVPPARIRNIYQTLVDGHAKSILDGKPLTADDAVRNLALCAATHASAQDAGRLVAVDGLHGK